MTKILSLSPMQINIFIGTFLAVFVVVSLQLLGIKPAGSVTPLPDTGDVFFDKIVPELQVDHKVLSVYKPNNLIPQAKASADYDNAGAFAVIDMETGEVYHEKKLATKRSIASLTKIMSSVVALDLATPDETFVVSAKAAAKIPTKIGVLEGERLTVKELIHAALLTSANDAVEVLKEGIDEKYGEDVFIRAMNEKARMLGMEKTSFTNAQGFDNPENYSTVQDLAILSHYALKNYPLIAEASAKDYLHLPANENHKQFDLFNWNGLLGTYPETTGLKIGSTGAAGKTTVVTSSRGGKELLVVVLGAPGIIERDMWAAELLDYGYMHTLNLPPVQVTEDQLQAKYATWQY